ncbi:membrane-bound lytic murein transglycosylase MltF [Dasania sp. GY-MA-18]|uniref:Membrane-bound lytic murein transglycosylase F n=1 Tax=Dasania phycosphaerae TaxID=2950436 RepID=A0A9J6RRS2_9GAMM|nr:MULTISPECIES: membrane-bound lytic murein transglycosylase MltF [Dasania]MCR8924202.1 membrane-bound lytic murein transglycosylase MltF [Dasania sp. GY-MA-18]MCZ0866855.1 membrane-bound lytic murein transglycosylase MltF [Dasania phycosphaerae]MCZ0870360.1 membrane-bound lytic murein transglycosylase MltF [Dasania phycosphaerae]
MHYYPVTLTPRLRQLLSSLWLMMLLSACDFSKLEPDNKTHLKVVTRNGLTTYYQDKNGPTGFEYELVKRYAEFQNLELEFVSVHSLDDIFTALRENRADLAAAGLTITPQRQQQWLFSPSYLDVQQWVIYNRKTHRKPKALSDLIGNRMVIMTSSSHGEILQQLQLQHPELSWHEAPDAETIDLLDMVANGESDYTVIDSNDFIANRGFYPSLRPAFEIGDPGQLAWALPKNAHSEQQLLSLAAFFKEITEDGTLQQLQERFYSHAEEQEQVSTNTFAKAVDNKLPQYRELIEKTAQQYNIDWRLLASISYQESHWNPRARSPTGVRGMMMLTQSTAKEMNIINRLDLEQSLQGGAAYFKKIKRKLPSAVKEPDRTWFALAAYNLGLGHIKDVRKITKQQGGDPNKWADIKTRLPLLQKRNWYRNTKYGYARGQEALTYVQNIRHYYNYLQWSELSQNRTPPPKQMDQYLPESLLGSFDAL